MEPSASLHIPPEANRGPQKAENQSAQTPAVSVPVHPPHVPTNLPPNPAPQGSQDPQVYVPPSPHAPTNYDGRAFSTIQQPASSSQIPVAQAPIAPAASVPPPHAPTNSNDVSAIPQHASSSQAPIAQASHPHYSPFQKPTHGQYPTFQTQGSTISQVPPPGSTTYTYVPFGAPGAIPQNEPQGPPHVWQQYHYPGGGGNVSPPPQNPGYYSVDTSAPQGAAVRYYTPPPAVFESASTPRPGPRHTSAPPQAIQVPTTSNESISTPSRRYVSAPPPAQPRAETLSTPPMHNERSTRPSSFEIDTISNSLIHYDGNAQPLVVASLTTKNNDKEIKEGHRVKARYIHCDRKSYVPIIIPYPVLPSNWRKLPGDLFIITTGTLGPTTNAETVWMFNEQGSWNNITDHFNSGRLDTAHLVRHPATAIAHDHFLSRHTSAGKPGWVTAKTQDTYKA